MGELVPGTPSAMDRIGGVDQVRGDLVHELHREACCFPRTQRSVGFCRGSPALDLVIRGFCIEAEAVQHGDQLTSLHEVPGRENLSLRIQQGHGRPSSLPVA